MTNHFTSCWVRTSLAPCLTATACFLSFSFIFYFTYSSYRTHSPHLSPRSLTPSLQRWGTQHPSTVHCNVHEAIQHGRHAIWTSDYGEVCVCPSPSSLLLDMGWCWIGVWVGGCSVHIGWGASGRSSASAGARTSYTSVEWPIWTSVSAPFSSSSYLELMLASPSILHSHSPHLLDSSDWWHCAVDFVNTGMECATDGASHIICWLSDSG